MALREYQRKREFTRTPEPAAKTAQKGGSSYVIQKHDASHLHYDFRLEMDGVLKSWAVPKGPSLDPAVKRLAVEVEDHPVAYGSFEGTIPEGEYGGGTVLLWDRGTWEPIGDAQKGYDDGKLKFILHGEKLRGKWMLLRTGRSGSSSKPQWLLVKEHDEKAQPSDEGDILEQMPLSVHSQRDLKQIASAPERAWSSKSKKPVARPASVKRGSQVRSKKAPDPKSESSKPGSIQQPQTNWSKVTGRAAAIPSPFMKDLNYDHGHHHIIVVHENVWQLDEPRESRIRVADATSRSRQRRRPAHPGSPQDG